MNKGIEPFAKFKIGDKIRGRDSTGIVDSQPGIVRAVHTTYPTADDYEDLTNPGIVYEVSFMKGTFLLKIIKWTYLASNNCLILCTTFLI